MFKNFIRRNGSKFNSEVLKPYLKDYKHNIKVDEIEIKLPNGSVIAGKWWGSKTSKPFICLHGLQDNASTFDRLIPLLPQQFSYLSLDFPGHGRSSWIPHGVPYQMTTNFVYIHEVLKTLNLGKVGFLGHSMGGYNAFIYAALFPEKVDMLITFDIWKAPDMKAEIEGIAASVKNFEKADKKVREGIKPKNYSIDEMLRKIHKGSLGNISMESAAHLLKRNIRKSDEEGKFYLTRDNRLSQMILFANSTSILLQMAQKMKIPFLFLAAEETPLYNKTKFYDQFIDLTAPSCWCYEFSFSSLLFLFFLVLKDYEKFSAMKLK